MTYFPCSLTIPSNNSRGKQIAATDACMKGATSAGGGESNISEWRSGGEKLSLLPFPKGSGRGRKHRPAA